METLIDPFELHAPGSDRPQPAQSMRPRLPSIVIDVDWEDPPSSSHSLHGVRVWSSED